MSTTAVDTTRPEGQPGKVSIGSGTRRDVWGEKYRTGLTYPAVRDERTGVVRYWRDTETSSACWLVAPPLVADSFEPGPDWQEHCPHEHGAPWRTCSTESECIALKREDGWQ